MSPHLACRCGLRALQAEGPKHRTKRTGTRQMPHWTGKMVTVSTHSYSDEYLARCEALRQRCVAINRGEA